MDGIITERLPFKRWFIRYTRPVTLQFGMWVWCGIAERHGLTMNELSQVDNETFMREALYFAQQWSAFKDKTKEYDEQTVQYWIDNMPQKQLQRIFDALLKSRMGGESIMGLLETTGKKKQESVS